MANVAVVERTLALIKPDALSKSEEVLDVIRNNGFTVLQVSALVVLFKLGALHTDPLPVAC